MRICFALIAVLFFLSFDAYAQDVTYVDEAEILNQANVRGFIWGLPNSIIKSEEKSIFVEEAEDGALFYVDTIRGIKSSITYEFRDDKLDRVRIFSEKKYPQPQDRMDDLIKIKRDLDERFGEPIEENFKWLKDTDKQYPEYWGWAVYRGELFVTITWEDAETFVTAYLGSPETYDPVLFVMYEDVKAKNARIDKKASDAIKILP